jgi:5-methylcytosine-specific restriction enzyme A
MTLKRACLGCGRLGRWTRCPACHRKRDQAKAARRPDLHNDRAERRRRAEAVADHRAIVGDWCPGWAGRPAHAAADLTADHVKEVAAGGRPTGRLVVRCRSCNAARSAHLARRALAMLTGSPQDGQPATPRQPESATHSGDGPVVA